MSNIGEQQEAKSWIITLECADGSMAMKSVHAAGDSLAEAAQRAQLTTTGNWTVIAGRLLR